MAWSAGQKYLAEFLGTFALLLFGGGAAVFSLTAAETGNARVVLVSLAFGVTVLGGAYAFGEISGGHFNPAVTLSMAASRKMPLRDVVPYLVAQLFGGLAGIAIVYGIVAGAAGPLKIAQNAGLGSQCYMGNGAPCIYSLGSVFLLEVALTFVFVLIIHRVTSANGGAGNLAPVAIGLTLAVTNLVGIPVDGASINPVRSFAPAVLSAGSVTWPIDQAWLFWVAPIVGGLLAAAVDAALRPRT